MSNDHELPAVPELWRLGDTSTFAKFSRTVVTLAAVIGAFGFFGGCFATNEPAPARRADALERVDDVDSGLGGDLAKGISASGAFKNGENDVGEGGSMDMTLFPGFERGSAATDVDVNIVYVRGGSGPPLLLLHGHPQTSAIWHRVAPALAGRFTVVAADLRGYGDSSKPPGAPDHANYAKRTMARDMLVLMRSLGFERFDVLAHDRGARVAHRLAADHPEAVRRLALLDIVPTLAMYEQTTEVFARAYWHWFFLIQPAPLPERLIEADPAAYVRDMMGRRSAGLAPFDERALAEYQRCAALPGAAHSMCKDYRAAASIDLEHERADRDAGLQLPMPVLVLWGKEGVVHRCFKPLEEWGRIAPDLRGGPLPCGHYIAEEAPDRLLEEVLPFFTSED